MAEHRVMLKDDKDFWDILGYHVQFVDQSIQEVKAHIERKQLTQAYHRDTLTGAIQNARRQLERLAAMTGMAYKQMMLDELSKDLGPAVFAEDAHEGE